MLEVIDRRVRFAMLAIALVLSLIAPLGSMAAQPAATPAAASTASTSCPDPVGVEQVFSDIRVPGTSRLAYSQTLDGDTLYTTSTICRDANVAIPATDYADGTILIVTSGRLPVTVTAGIAVIIIAKSPVPATIGQTVTLASGDEVIFENGVEAAFPSTSGRTVINVLTISSSTSPSGCVHSCFIP